jgi:hypothetical protein
MPPEVLSDELRRALSVLARHHDGCTEAGLVADGFSIGQLSGLAIDGFAKIELRRMNISGRERSVIWMTITTAGRKAIAD